MEIRGRYEWNVVLVSAITLGASVHCGCLQLTLQVKRWGSMHLSNLSQVFQQIWSTSRTWTKIGWNESPCALCNTSAGQDKTPTGHWVSLCRDITQRIRKLSSYQLTLEAVLPCLRTRQAGPLPWPSTLHFGMPSLSSPPLSGNTQNHQQEPRQDLLAPVPMSTFGDIIQLSNPLSPPPTHMRNGPCGPRSSGIMPMYQSQAPWAGLIPRG